MAATLKTVLAALKAQGAQINQLVAQRDEAEQADLDKVQAAIDGNTALMAAALSNNGTSSLQGSGDTGGTPAATTTATVTAPAAADTSSLTISASVAPAVGAAVTGGAVAPGTTVADGSTTSTLVLSTPTTGSHVGDGSETLTITPPVA